MNRTRFDALARTLAAPGTRRRLLGAVAAGALGALSASSPVGASRTRPVGSACAQDGHCGYGARCLAEGRRKVCTQVCGADGLACCADNGCLDGFGCEQSICVPLCGSDGAACCPGEACGDGLTCYAGVCDQTVDCSANLTGAGCEYLAGPGLWNCGSQNLSGVNLSGCDLTNASFFNTNASSARFIGTNLTGANFFGATVTSAEWNDTICPLGTNSDDNGDTCCGQFISGQTPTGCGT